MLTISFGTVHYFAEQLNKLFFGDVAIFVNINHIEEFFNFFSTIHMTFQEDGDLVDGDGATVIDVEELESIFQVFNSDVLRRFDGGH